MSGHHCSGKASVEAECALLVRPEEVWGWRAAWYNTWPSHFKEVECFQQQVEPILFKYGVDMVFTGHTHAYEVRLPAPR